MCLLQNYSLQKKICHNNLTFSSVNNIRITIHCRRRVSEKDYINIYYFLVLYDKQQQQQQKYYMIKKKIARSVLGSGVWVPWLDKCLTSHCRQFEKDRVVCRSADSNQKPTKKINGSDCFLGAEFLLKLVSKPKHQHSSARSNFSSLDSGCLQNYKNLCFVLFCPLILASTSSSHVSKDKDNRYSKMGKAVTLFSCFIKQFPTYF